MKTFNKKSLEINFDFSNKINTVILAEYFCLLYSNKFIYQNEQMYYFNGVYWEAEHKSELTILNIFLGKTFYKQLIDEFKIYKKKNNPKDSDDKKGIFEKILTKLEDLVNYDKRIKIVRECIHFLTNNKIQFDENPLLFAFENKFFDLVESKFINPEPTQYISITTGYDYEDGSNKIDELHKLFKSIFPNQEIRELYLTLLSTGLDGIPLEKFILANGQGGNGKGLLNELTSFMLGNYAYVLPSNLLLGTIKAGSNTELGLLNKKRFVVSREPDSNLQLNCNTIKEITGGDELNARVIYSKNTKVNLHLSFFLECNERPKLNEVNDALRRRIVDVLFGQKFVEKQEYEDTMEDMTDEERKYCKIGLINPLYKQKKFKNDFKCSLFIILSQYYKKFHDNNRSLVLPVETIQRNNNYMVGSDDMYSWIINN